MSALRYTMEIEVGGRHHVATSVVQTSAHPLPSSTVERPAYQLRYRGEALGFRFPDGKALLVSIPVGCAPAGYGSSQGFWYASSRAEIVERLTTEARTVPIDFARPGTLSSCPPRAFVLDDAVSPTALWKLDWRRPDVTLGAEARIVRFEMTPTRDAPTFDLAGTVPWAVRQGSAATWRGVSVYRGSSAHSPRDDPKRRIVVSRRSGKRAVLLDVTAEFTTDYHSLVERLEKVDVRYSDGLARVTVLAGAGEDTASTRFFPEHLAPRRPAPDPPRPGTVLDVWRPVLCLVDLGCVDILVRPGVSRGEGAVIDPATNTLFAVRLESLLIGRVGFPQGRQTAHAGGTFPAPSPVSGSAGEHQMGASGALSPPGAGRSAAHGAGGRVAVGILHEMARRLRTVRAFDGRRRPALRADRDFSSSAGMSPAPRHVQRGRRACAGSCVQVLDPHRAEPGGPETAARRRSGFAARIRHAQ